VVRSALIVDDGRSRTALGAARALGSAGWRVGLGSPAPGGFVQASRHVSAWHAVPPASSSGAAFDAAVVAAVAAGRYDIVFATGDAEVLALSAVRDRLAAVVPYPPHATLLASIDKLELARAAAAAGLSAPWTALAADVADADLERPLIVKARLHWTPGSITDVSRFAATPTGTAAGVRACAAQIAAAGGEAVVQELVTGVLTAFVAVTDAASEVLVACQQRAERVFPVGAGNSVRAVTTEPSEQLARGAARLLTDLGWVGLAQLQFVDDGTRPPMLIDLNGRFYGSMPLAVGAGVNLPAIWAASALGDRLPPVGQARPGVRFSSLALDLRRAVAERHGGLLSDLAASVLGSVGAVHAVWDRTDPAPARRQARDAVVSRLRGLRGRRP
jgi:predicted ATP-grasp superfamily ATP-dependent carboligase